MNASFKRLIFLLALVASMTSAVAADLPRLWEVTGRSRIWGEGKFYILPVTHNGLDVEYDDYFFKTILPTALKADVFLQESAVIVPSEMPPCIKPLADTPKNREILRQAFIDVERAEYGRQPHIPRMELMSDQDWSEIQQGERSFAHDAVSKLTEYGLISAMGEALNEFLSRNHAELLRGIDYTPKPEIADYLQHQRWARGIKANEPIELGRDLAEAYCNINSARRGRYLQRAVRQADPSRFKPMSNEMRRTSNVAFVESIEMMAISSRFADSYLDARGDEYGKHVVCDRNEKWLTKMRDAVGIDVRFYAVGMAHVMQPSASNKTRCDGLLKRLKDEGYSVRLFPDHDAGLQSELGNDYGWSCWIVWGITLGSVWH